MSWEREYLEIVKKLIPGVYIDSYGSPFAEEFSKKLVKDVKERVPELRDTPDEDIEEKFLDVIDWAKRRLCQLDSSWEYAPEGGDYYKGIMLYECRHPETGVFYLVTSEENDQASGFWHIYLRLTRDYHEAQREFEDEKADFIDMHESVIDNENIYTYKRSAYKKEKRGLLA